MARRKPKKAVPRLLYFSFSAQAGPERGLTRVAGLAGGQPQQQRHLQRAAALLIQQLDSQAPSPHCLQHMCHQVVLRLLPPGSRSF